MNGPGPELAVAAWVGAIGLAAADMTLSARENGAVVVLAGDVVVKVHPPGTDADDLAARLALAADPAYAGVLAAPLEPKPYAAPARSGLAGRLASVWPRLDVLAPDVAAAPWADAAAVLAALHTRPAPSGGPAHGGPGRLARALDRLAQRDGNGARVVLAAGRAVEAELAAAAAAPPRPTHGDWHLGQLARAGGGPWLLIDVDDLGGGDPAWDLARPAGFWAAGLLPDADWQAFLAAYREAGGPAVPPAGDPWPALDAAARAEVVVAAARAIRRVDTDGWDDTAEALVATCLRMPRGSSAR